MSGNVTHAVLGPPLLPKEMKTGEIAKDAEGWHLEAWDANAGSTARFSADDGGSFIIDCPSKNDVSIVQNLALEPSANYVLTAEVKTQRVKIMQPGGKFAVELRAGDSQSTKDLSGSVDWTPIVLPFTTKAGTASCTVRMEMGGRGSLTSGRAFFRNVQVKKVGYPLAESKAS